jgi:hypothetical protein
LILSGDKRSEEGSEEENLQNVLSSETLILVYSVNYSFHFPYNKYKSVKWKAEKYHQVKI